jgi:hypothetical protein
VSLGAGDRDRYRYQLREIRGAVDQAQLAAQSAVRSYRNVLSVAVLVLLLCAVAFPLAARSFSSEVLTVRPGPVTAPSQATTPSPSAPSSTATPSSTPAASALSGAATSPAPTPPTPSTGATATSEPPTASENSEAARNGASPSSPPTFGDLATIEGWGVLGGLIGAVASLRRLRTSRDPAGLHLAQLALKLPAGALTALFGVVLLQSGILPLSPATSGQIAAYAVLFGFAQEAITRFVDQQSGRILEGALPLSAKASAALSG